MTIHIVTMSQCSYYIVTFFQVAVCDWGNNRTVMLDVDWEQGTVVEDEVMLMLVLIMVEVLVMVMVLVVEEEVVATFG